MPVFSLPGKYGIGSFGKESREFVDYLAAAEQSVWQVLPLGQTSFGDSPYQPLADDSLNPYFIDLEALGEEGLLTGDELKSAERPMGDVDYGDLYRERFPLLKKAYARFEKTDDFYLFSRRKRVFCACAFASLKELYGCSFDGFPERYRRYDPHAINLFISKNRDAFYFRVFLQYILERQFAALKAYAKEKGVALLGDLPLYVGYDSADVWANPGLFRLDGDLCPKEVAGVPPDYFSEDGQLWGNPIYDYAAMEKDGFRWWKARLKNALSRFDIVRIDHFRGLDRFWSVPFGQTARSGKWETCPGREILRGAPSSRLVAEDLGTIDDGVRSLMRETGLRGMKVLLFAFDGNPDNPYLPENVPSASVCYTGTHDNDTVAGYRQRLSPREREIFDRRAKESFAKLGVGYGKTDRGVSRAFVRAAYACKAELAVVPFADVKGLGNGFRINTPATVGNWKVRFPKKLFDDESAEFLSALARRYGRSPGK